MFNSPFVRRGMLSCSVLAILSLSVRGEEIADVGKFIQYGEMHRAIGQGLDQGRVDIAKIVAMPHFYGVGALAGLEGEIAILDSQPVITGVVDGALRQPVAAASAKATMLAGQSVDNWMTVSIEQDVPCEKLDETIEELAESHGIDITQPLVFTIEGEFTDVRVHVINGACPIRARMKKETLDKDHMPYELEVDAQEGTVVGVLAKDSVGKLTHPATSTHAHLVYVDPKLGRKVTGHIEQIGVAKNAVLRFPADRSGK